MCVCVVCVCVCVAFAVLAPDPKKVTAIDQRCCVCCVLNVEYLFILNAGIFLVIIWECSAGANQNRFGSCKGVYVHMSYVFAHVCCVHMRVLCAHVCCVHIHVCCVHMRTCVVCMCVVYTCVLCAHVETITVVMCAVVCMYVCI